MPIRGPKDSRSAVNGDIRSFLIALELFLRATLMLDDDSVLRQRLPATRVADRNLRDLDKSESSMLEPRDRKQGTNLTERRRRWTWWSMGELTRQRCGRAQTIRY